MKDFATQYGEAFASVLNSDKPSVVSAKHRLAEIMNDYMETHNIEPTTENITQLTTVVSLSVFGTMLKTYPDFRQKFIAYTKERI